VDHDGFLAQAFDADDVIGEFVDEKQKLEEEAGPQIIDDRLFGWGSWTGPGIDEEKQAKKKERYHLINLSTLISLFFRFLKKTAPKDRADKGKSGVIIRSEETDERLAQFQPKDVPFPFTAVKDFEAVIRQPLGRDWNTNIAHKNLIKKAVNTKAGRIIRPIDKEEGLHKSAEAIFADKDDDEFDELLH
jgi:U3 small nucleolar RNA-associated protein 14